MVVYADILLTINLAVDYLLLFAAARLAGAEFARLRGLLGAAAGALYSLVIFLSLPAALLAATKLAASALMIFFAFGKRRPSEFLRLLVIFYVCGFVFSGFMMLMDSVLHADSFFVQGGIVYFEFSAVGIVLSAAAAFAVTEFLRRLFRHGEPEGACMVRIFYGGESVVLKGFTDTGNELSDPFTGTPVAVCRPDSLEKILPEKMRRAAMSTELSTAAGLRLIPCGTVSGSVLIPAFRPERAVLNMNGGVFEAEELLIGLSPKAPEMTLLLGKNIILKQAEKSFSEV